ncbi:MAG: 2-oxoacid:acceptor oxidoreductase family protein [Smithellaceae bacterium]|jgi:indolepyruvate ferredoxin oxidoreductase beta subunit|nr:2-oxoacid:acceptor oxidoreductase family protein [Syntrophaceae bacterium]MDD4241552.1 2-oxoacid:acceptor oxidoreductase family protein [Smithellaceae bacterium]NLX51781.1 pyruvate ferredoxin oxidoreductase [Deltaproteobacteria bacterium]
MKQQIIVSGLGGQGVVFATRLLAHAAMETGHPVLTSENHGMAMRGGTIISHVKIGAFHSPLIRQGHADIGLFLNRENLGIHGGMMKDTGTLFVNTPFPGAYRHCDATGLAMSAGAVVVANLVLLGFAVRTGGFFCTAGQLEDVIQRISPPKQLNLNLKGFRLGLEAQRSF